jgi:hypothetical protein
MSLLFGPPLSFKSSVHSFVRSFIRSFIHSFVHSFLYSSCSSYVPHFTLPVSLSRTHLIYPHPNPSIHLPTMKFLALAPRTILPILLLPTSTFAAPSSDLSKRSYGKITLWSDSYYRGSNQCISPPSLSPSPSHSQSIPHLTNPQGARSSAPAPA